MLILWFRLFQPLTPPKLCKNRKQSSRLLENTADLDLPIWWSAKRRGESVSASIPQACECCLSYRRHSVLSLYRAGKPVVSIGTDPFWWWECLPFGYGSIPINTIFRGMNIHLPAILMFTRGTRFWHTAIWCALGLVCGICRYFMPDSRRYGPYNDAHQQILTCPQPIYLQQMCTYLQVALSRALSLAFPMASQLVGWLMPLHQWSLQCPATDFWEEAMKWLVRNVLNMQRYVTVTVPTSRIWVLLCFFCAGMCW